MFCRNCGKELIGKPEICLSCGAKPLAGNSFCHSCGAPTDPLAEICIKCGAQMAKVVSPEGVEWMPMAAGILSIIAGVVGLLSGILVAAVGRIVGIDWVYELWMAGFPLIGFWIATVILIAIGIVAIIGGIFSLRRRMWGMALAGAICSFPSIWILAIPAIIFVAMSKREFK